MINHWNHTRSQIHNSFVAIQNKLIENSDLNAAEILKKSSIGRCISGKTATPLGGHVFHPTETIFELVQDFIGTHVPTKFHEDWTKNVTSRVLTRFYYYSHIRKTATPPGSHVFNQPEPFSKTKKSPGDILTLNE